MRLTLDKTDRAIIQSLKGDGRMPFSTIATAAERVAGYDPPAGAAPDGWRRAPVCGGDASAQAPATTRWR